MSQHRVRVLPLTAAAIVIALTFACGGSPTDPQSGSFPTSNNPANPTPAPSPAPSGGTLTYTRDVQPILASDCATCHAPSRRSGGIDLSSYAEVMRVVTPGDPNSRLVLATQPGGLMYSQFRGNAAQKAATIRSWVVDSRAAQ